MIKLPFNRKTIKKAFDTWKFRDYLPFWREQGTPLIEFMNEKNIPFREWNDFFKHHGSDIYELMKKLSVDRMMDEDFVRLTDNQKGMIGTTLMLEFMKQLHIEIEELDRDKG